MMLMMQTDCWMAIGLHSTTSTEKRRSLLEAWRKRHYKTVLFYLILFIHLFVCVTQTLCPHVQHGQQSMLSYHIGSKDWTIFQQGCKHPEPESPSDLFIWIINKNYVFLKFCNSHTLKSGFRNSPTMCNKVWVLVLSETKTFRKVKTDCIRQTHTCA